MANPATIQPEKARRFAVDVVRALREAGHQAYWAGGCVRDRLLGKEPRDYDVATDALPERVRDLFGRKRTLAVGAAFGVITLLGPPGAGQIEIATFRQDADYSDGRHPDSVRYSTAENDALRRDFTINGLFFNPLDGQVIDFVGGQEDLRLHKLRAIGDPIERFTEDKLRMLRAVRFTVSLGFELDRPTFDAIRRMAGQITVVSPERITAEFRQIVTDPRRAAGIGLLIESGLAEAILPELFAPKSGDQARVKRMLDVLDRLHGPDFPLAFAVVLSIGADPVAARAIGCRWRLSNKEIERIVWLLDHRGALEGAHRRRWSSVQRVLVAEGAADLLHWMRAERHADSAAIDDVRWCEERLKLPRREIDPEPLLTGQDLIEHGVPPGPAYRDLLARVRDAQLDQRLASRSEALEFVTEHLAGTSTPHWTKEPTEMDKKAKKKIQTLNERLQKLRQQLAGAKKQADEPEEIQILESQIAEAEAEIAKLKDS